MRKRRDHGGPRRYPVQDCRGLLALGAGLVVIGLLLLVLCIPGWAWAALLGAALIVVGYVLICMSRR